MRSAVITGLGFISSIGNDARTVAEHLRTLQHGFSAVELLPQMAGVLRLIGRPAGFAFPQPQYLSWRLPPPYKLPRELLRGLNPHGAYAACATLQALDDAGLTLPELSTGETALFCASAGSPWLLNQNLANIRQASTIQGGPFGVINSISGTLNFNLGSYLKIRGGNCGFVSACSSSTHALGYALDEIRLGRHQRVVVVGAEDDIAETILPFAAMRVLAETLDPTRASCPFDVERAGFLACGGATCLILEDEEMARARGAQPYARLRGWAQTGDGYSTAQPDPSGDGVLRAMQQALRDASVPAHEVGYVNAHATSTVAGDAAEAKALTRLFAAQGTCPPISSTKALTGHGLSLAGAFETGLCALALRDGFIPGCAHLRTPCPEAADLNLPRTSLTQRPEFVLKNNSGFGGSNVSLVLQAC